ncbi:MAG: hypothetical protein KatS3mg105_3032 [Gemmatales bacterium]|nr:MAG: hypothetical protein KatS3mg105_3032 [Gemmatales bacterium]
MFSTKGMIRLGLIGMLGGAALLAYSLLTSRNEPQEAVPRPPVMEPIRLHLIPRGQPTPLAPTYRKRPIEFQNQ